MSDKFELISNFELISIRDNFLVRKQKNEGNIRTKINEPEWAYCAVSRFFPLRPPVELPSTRRPNNSSKTPFKPVNTPQKPIKTPVKTAQKQTSESAPQSHSSASAACPEIQNNVQNVGSFRTGRDGVPGVRSRQPYLGGGLHGVPPSGARPGLPPPRYQVGYENYLNRVLPTPTTISGGTQKSR